MSVQIFSSLENIPKHSTVCIPWFENFDQKLFNQLLAEYEISGLDMASSVFTGKRNNTEWIYPDEHVERLLIFGLGKFSPDQGKKTTIEVAAKSKDKFSASIILDVRSLVQGDIGSSAKKLITNIFKGLIIGLKDAGFYKSKQSPLKEYSYGLLVADDEGKNELHEAAKKGVLIAQTISRIIDLVNTPSNKKTTEHLAIWMQESSQENGFELEVLEKDDLEKQGFHALLAVNQGSPVPAKCLIATHNPGLHENIKTVVLVGKGVTFDTGGLSLKGSQNMHYMKSDMGGAAAVMGTVELAAKLKLPIHLVGIIPATDNSVDALALKPGDVISSFAGKSIEIIDTDAEGRLILADGLAYAIEHYKADYLLDLATLTGSVIRALGNYAAGIMSHNDKLVQSIMESGEKTEEKLWRLPLWEEYHEMMDSDIADIKNLSDKPIAGAITAAKFLEFFVDGHQAWAHLDIAGTAFGKFPTTKGYSATGFGVDLLINWLEKLSSSHE